MSNVSPTIVAASMDDEKLKASIEQMVKNLNDGLEKMKKSTDSAVEQMKRKLGELGNVKIDFGSSSSGGGTKKVENDQKSLEEQVKRTTQTAKEQSMTFDQLAEGLKSALGVVRDFNTKRENMLPSRQDYLEYERALTRIVEYNERLKSSALSLAAANERGFSFNGKAFTKDFDEVDARLKKLNDFYKNWEKESNRTFKKDFVAAMSLPTSNIDEITQKLIRLKMIVEVMNKNGLLDEKQVAAANSEISSLLSKLENQVQLQRSINSDERNGIADIQKKVEAERQYSDEVKNAAQMLRERFALMKEFTIFSKSGLTVYDPLKQEANSIESQLFAYKERHKEANLTLEVENAILQTEERITSQKNAQASQSNNGAKKTFAEYDDLRTAIAAVLRLEKEEVSVADKQNASFNALSMTLKHLQQAYLTLSASQRDSANADALIEKIHETQRAMKDIQNQMSRPISLDSAMALPENTIDDISYKIKMLRSYAQEVNTETKVGESTLLSISDKIEALNNKAKKVQKSTRQVSEEANNVKFDKLSKMPTDSIKQIGQKIKEVKGFIAELSKSPVIDEKNLMRAENLLNRLIKQAAKLNSEQGTEKNVNKALRERVNTLDDIARKMQRLQAIRQNLNINTQGAQIELINNKLRELRKQQDEILQRNQQIIASNNALGRSFNYMKNRLAFYFTVGASTAFVKNIINIRGQYELLERSIGILFDSMQTGTKIFSELNAMAIKSPFTTMELGAAAKQLSAYNIAAKDVVDTTRRLADIAAAVGVPIERLTYALGQIKSYGYLNSRDARMFANAGIPLIQNLADMYTKLEGRLVSIGDVYDRIKHKQVSFEDTLKVVNEMTDEGGRFFNFQEKAADTLVVRLANLTLAWNNMMNELGKDNTGLINSTLGGLKTIFEHWRDIDAAIWGTVKILGVLKTAQFAWLLLVRRTGIELALLQTVGAKLGDIIRNIALGLKALAFNPFTWIAAAVVALGYLYQKWDDLQEANETFNKSISDGAKENIDSINKFFDKYGKEIERIGSAKSTDQEKMWERIRDEIEKTTKNAQQYVDILEKIPDVAERVGKASEYLEHQQVLQQEAKRLADHGFFDLGGGFADDSLAEDLKDYEDEVSEIVKKYKTLEEAQKDFENTSVWTNAFHEMWKYYAAVEEVESELDKFTSSLDKVNLAMVMGKGSEEERFANIRSFAQLVRDNFLATEEGQKISTEGQARLNKEIDYWIAQKGVSNRLISLERAEVEENRSAWETFFNQISADEKRTLDYLVSTGQTTTEEFKKIWNDAAERMKESSLTGYEQIQEHIADLRKTAPIVIDVVYRETKESKDEAQKDFENRFTTPNLVQDLSAEAYLTEQKRLNTIYGRFNKKTGEDMVEWEKRLGQEYQDNEKKLSDYNKMLEGYNRLSDEEKKKREAQINTVTNERDALKATQDALKEIQTWENFDFEQFKKGKKGSGSKKDFLGEAFAKVVEVTGNMQKRFKEYRQAGVDANTALEKSTMEYEKTLEKANNTLAKYGVMSTKSGSELANMELRDLRTYYESLLTIAKGVGNTKGVEALEKAIASLNVEITNIDYKKITDGLNNKLNKLNDEYELAVELDANPELGSMFADMMGINTETLPRTVEEYASEYTRLLNKYLKDKNQGIELPNLYLTNDDIGEFKRMVDEQKLSQEAYDYIIKAINDVRDKKRKDFEETRKEYEALIKKYGEYEAKLQEVANTADKERLAFAKQFGDEEQKSKAIGLVADIQAETDPKTKEELRKQLQELVKSIAGNDDVKIKLQVAIDNQQVQEQAAINFEEFRKSGLWRVATGNLSGLTDNALGGLISSLERFKKTEKGLDAKKLKEIDRVIRSLRKQQREGNPFLAIGNAMDEAEERAAELQPQMEEIMRKIVALDKKRESGNKLTDEEEKELESLNQQWKDLWSTTEVSATEIVGFLNNCISYASQAVSMFTEMANALSGGKWNEGLEILNDVTSTIEKAGQGAAIGAQVGGGWGAVLGGIAGGLMGAITAFADNSNKRIDATIKDSEVAVKRLELAYVDLEHAMDKAYGTGIVGSKKLYASMKELELAELEHQLALEQSRRQKDRDEGKIADLQKQIKELRYEIEDTITEITNDILGGDAGSFAEGLVDAMIDAFKNGENYMKVFEEKFDDMVDNMIMKSITSRVVAQYIDRIWDDMDARISERSNAEAEKLASATKRREELEAMDIYAYAYETYGLGKWGIDHVEEARKQMEELYELDLLYAKDAEKKAQEAYDAVSGMNDSDISMLISELAEIKPELGEKLREILGEYYKFGETSDKELSALQQGISSITETTAGALEAYMNGVSQQVYLHSDLLSQIRDAVVGFSMDVQLGAMSQILLQLQMNYQITESIHSMMSGWNNPAGNAVRVELI